MGKGLPSCFRNAHTCHRLMAGAFAFGLVVGCEPGVRGRGASGDDQADNGLARQEPRC
jgi:hypothetical protein